MHTDIQTGLLALHGNRSEALAEAVLTWLRQRPLAPLEEEVILVQSAGMAEWLKMTLARDGGVCAAMRVELPARFMWRTYRQVLGRDQVPSQCATDKAPLTWRLMHLLPQWMHAPGFEAVAGFLQGDEPDRLYQLASRLADLFDQYQGPGVEPGSKSLAMGLILQDVSRTLTEQDADATVAAAVAAGHADVGIVMCWTGTGVSIAANKVAGVRAALCADAATVAGARRWNDANVLALGMR